MFDFFRRSKPSTENMSTNLQKTDYENKINEVSGEICGILDKFHETVRKKNPQIFKLEWYCSYEYELSRKRVGYIESDKNGYNEVLKAKENIISILEKAYNELDVVNMALQSNIELFEEFKKKPFKFITLKPLIKKDGLYDSLYCVHKYVFETDEDGVSYMRALVNDSINSRCYEMKFYPTDGVIVEMTTEEFENEYIISRVDSLNLEKETEVNEYIKNLRGMFYDK